MAKSQVAMKINGKTVEALVELRTLLIYFLREQLSLTGPHIGCETSHCGACTVDLNGKSVKSCTVLAVQADGGDIITIEGIANPDGTLHALQEGFREMHGLQCGFCTPGMITRAYRLLQENKNPSEEEIRFLADIKKYSTTLSEDDKKLVLAMIRKMATIIPPPRAGKASSTSSRRAEL